MNNEKPLYRHDCSKCIFLGTTEFRGDVLVRQVDLYACVKEYEKTVIARFGDDGPDYTSGICFGMQAIAEKREHPLRTAIERAKARGIDLGEEADESLVRYCERHRKAVVPGTQCWDCGMEEMQERIKNNPRRATVAEAMQRGAKKDA